MTVIEDFESRPHKAVTSKEERRDRNGTSKNCRRRYLDTAEEDYQEEARKRKVGKKEKKAKEANKDKGLKGNTEYKDGIARRLRMKKKRKAGKKATKWQNNWKRSNIWKT